MTNQLVRTILRIKGADTFGFVEGLSSQEINNTLSYTAFLSGKGRIIGDAFMIKENSAIPSVIFDCDPKVSSNLVSHLENCILRSDVEVEDATEDYSIWHSRIDNSTLPNSFIDPRMPALGRRSIVPNGTNENSRHPENGSAYFNSRIRLGVLEGHELTDMLPFEANLDRLNALNLERSVCYLGQEMVSRSWHRGVIRRRLAPFTFDLTHTKAMRVGDPIVNEERRRVGKVRFLHGNLGVATLPYPIKSNTYYNAETGIEIRTDIS